MFKKRVRGSKLALMLVCRQLVLNHTISKGATEEEQIKTNHMFERNK